MNLSRDDEDTLQMEAGTAPDIAVTRWAGRSSIGRIRRRNEDAWGELDRRVFAVADGMGGAEGGARASTLAVAGFLTADPSQGWLSALRHLNASINGTCTTEGLPTAGSTLVGLVIDGPRCVTISIGDSRIYRLRNDRFDKLTTDHNVRTLRIEEGLAPNGTDDRGKPAALTSYLGNPVHSQRIDVGTIGAANGDRLLLCSDGVHGQIPDQTLAALVAGPAPLDEVASTILATADNAGGRDNATVVLLDLEVLAS